jgi:hypothetical protein
MVFRPYYKKNIDPPAPDGDTGYRLATVGYLFDYTKRYFPSYIDLVRDWESPGLDANVYGDYAERLIPRAVGYSAAVLDYFFRGEMGVACLPIFFDNGIYALWVKIMNTTTTQETMSNGTFSLVCRYTPIGGSPDGSDDIFVQCPDVACDILQYGDEYEELFYLTQPIPIDTYESVRCMLAFQGTLGNELGAVIGKSFTLGEIKFNEEWDNGLDGNHPWTHTTADDNPPNGNTINTIEDDILIKENIRYEGNSTARYNDSSLELVEGIPITHNTYLQFRIADMSINEPADAWQDLRLAFNNGLELQFIRNGGKYEAQYFGPRPNTAYYYFDLGFIIVDNIYALFENAGITIPEALYLEEISFYQQLMFQDDPTTVEHHQHMEIDFIRIVEEYEEPE